MASGWVAWSLQLAGSPLTAPWARITRTAADDCHLHPDTPCSQEEASSSTNHNSRWWGSTGTTNCSARPSNVSASSTGPATPTGTAAPTTTSTVTGTGCSSFSSSSHAADGSSAPPPETAATAITHAAAPQRQRGVLRWLQRTSWRAGAAALLAAGCLGQGHGPLARTALVFASVVAWHKAGGQPHGQQHTDQDDEHQGGLLLTASSPLQPTQGNGATTGRRKGPLSRNAGAELLIASFAHSSPAVLLWLTPDTARRLVAQCGGDVSKARDKVRAIHEWRQHMGLQLVRFPPRPAARTAAAPRSLQPTRQHQHVSQQQAAVRAAVRHFGAVSRAIGWTLVHTDDTRGLVVLWIEGASMCNTRKALTQHLLEEARELAAATGTAPHEQTQHSAGRRTSAPDQPVDWLQRITLHVALMSSWLWGTRLPDQPLAAGRFVQVIDLQGVPTAMLMCGDGPAIIKAIMAAAHQFPQRLLATVVINPPRGLTVAWAVVSKLLPPQVQQKIRFIRSRQPEVLRAELLQFLPEELLPVDLGGKRQTHKGEAAGTLIPRPAAQQELESAMAHCSFADE